MKYQVNRLVFFEQHEKMNSAIAGENESRKWNRKWNRHWKLRLIEELEPQWEDLYSSLR